VIAYFGIDAGRLGSPADHRIGIGYGNDSRQSGPYRQDWP
jgi:hypothetical protein